MLNDSCNHPRPLDTRVRFAPSRKHNNPPYILVVSQVWLKGKIMNIVKINQRLPQQFFFHHSVVVVAALVAASMRLFDADVVAKTDQCPDSLHYYSATTNPPSPKKIQVNQKGAIFDTTLIVEIPDHCRFSGNTNQPFK